MKLNSPSMLPRLCHTGTASSIRTASITLVLSIIYKHGITKRRVNDFSRLPALEKMLQLFQQLSQCNTQHVSRNSVRTKSLSILQKVTHLSHKVSRYEYTPTLSSLLFPNNSNYFSQLLLFIKIQKRNF